MSAIKQFIEKISHLESRGTGVDYRIPMNDARILRDELAKLLHDYYALANTKSYGDEVIKIEVNGGKF